MGVTIAAICFTAVFVLIFALLLSPPTKLVDKLTGKKPTDKQ